MYLEFKFQYDLFKVLCMGKTVSIQHGKDQYKIMLDLTVEEMQECIKIAQETWYPGSPLVSTKEHS